MMDGRFQGVALGMAPMDVGGPVAVLMGLGLPEAEHSAAVAREAKASLEHSAAAMAALYADDCDAARQAALGAGHAYGSMRAHILSSGMQPLDLDATALAAEDAYVRVLNMATRKCGGLLVPPPQVAPRAPAGPPPGFRPPPSFGPPPGGMDPFVQTMDGARMRFGMGMKDAGRWLRMGSCGEARRQVQKAANALWLLGDAAESMPGRPSVASRDELGLLGRRLDTMRRVWADRCMGGTEAPGGPERARLLEF